ncbi:MAG TPA: protein-L-isoaspartate(D-aspartate) O-methyltransferase [Azospirillaceae bacterium]|nr:protein-L-isoaspartate(D-aspartate) O-methyltransferase [Azospirillaceae bacterium]
MTDFAAERRKMVERQIAGRGIRDKRVLEAMGSVPREAFAPKPLIDFAYADTPLPLTKGATISQPYIVAFMAEKAGVSPGERVLEIGTGSGYAAAVLNRMGAEVFTVERDAALAEQARERLARPGYEGIHVRVGDGALGWPEAAPFAAIVVTAAPEEVPEALKEQLAPGGRLVVPVTDKEGEQRLKRLTRRKDGSLREEDLGWVRFVPLVSDPPVPRASRPGPGHPAGGRAGGRPG